MVRDQSISFLSYVSGRSQENSIGFELPSTIDNSRSVISDQSNTLIINILGYFGSLDFTLSDGTTQNLDSSILSSGDLYTNNVSTESPVPLLVDDSRFIFEDQSSQKILYYSGTAVSDDLYFDNGTHYSLEPLGDFSKTPTNNQDINPVFTDLLSSLDFIIASGVVWPTLNAQTITYYNNRRTVDDIEFLTGQHYINISTPSALLADTVLPTTSRTSSYGSSLDITLGANTVISGTSNFGFPAAFPPNFKETFDGKAIASQKQVWTF